MIYSSKEILKKYKIEQYIVLTKIHKSNLSSLKVNWLDISTGDAISKILDYIYELDEVTVVV